MNCIAIGWNFINKGHHNYPYLGQGVRDGKMSRDWVYFRSGDIVKFDPMMIPDGVETVEHCIEKMKRRSDICRIWKYYEDGSKECVYYYYTDE